MEQRIPNKSFLYQWKNYLNAGGQNVVNLFNGFLFDQHSLGMTMEECEIAVAEKIKALNNRYCPTPSINDRCYNAIMDFSNIIVDGEIPDVFGGIEPTTVHEAMTLFEAAIRDLSSEQTLSDSDIFDYFSNKIEYFSFYLSILYSDLFVPYFFYGNFNIVTYIATEFGMSLPAIPAKKNYLGRFYYYAELCDIFHAFREENGFSVPELWAFLYDYAPSCVGLTNYIQESLPSPRSAFLIGSSPKDIYLGEQTTLWQCNPNTRAGDMILMYMKHPDCKIGSVWRSVSAGFNDPFFWYYRCCYIRKAEKIDGFTLAQLTADKKWGKLPIVRKNMQGVNGVEVPPSLFNYLLNECNTTSIERIAYAESLTDLSIVNEHDVEIKLVEPLLAKLGWQKSDYITQMNVKLGSGKDRLIPDYVIRPVEIPRHESGQIIVEVKKSIKKAEQRDEAIGQARSYARQLKSQLCAVISQEGIWITAHNDDFNEIMFTASFEQLNDVDKFNELNKIIGK